MAVLFSGCGSRRTAVNGHGDLVGSVLGGKAGKRIAKQMDAQRLSLAAALPQIPVATENRGEALKLSLPAAAFFEPNSNALTGEARPILHRLADCLAQRSDTFIRILGYTDHTGKAVWNLALSEKRAQRIYDCLRDDGLDAGRLGYEGEGFRNPVADNARDSGRRLNRRVEIWIYAGEQMMREARKGWLR
ncbi:MAG: OmpA family protein [Tannerella sp.]|nr:OmpA family protein [Tannerella sp.]